MTKTPLIEKTPVIRQMLINKGVREGSRVKVSIMGDMLKMHQAGWQFIAMFKDSGCFRKLDKSTFEITPKFHSIKNEDLIKHYPQYLLKSKKAKISSRIEYDNVLGITSGESCNEFVIPINAN